MIYYLIKHYVLLQLYEIFVIVVEKKCSPKLFSYLKIQF